MVTQAYIKGSRFVRGTYRDDREDRPVTSVHVTIGLTAAQASRLPSHGQVRSLLGKDANKVSSLVWRGGGEIELVYRMSKRPFDGADAADIPTLALQHVRGKLSANNFRKG